MPKAAWLRPFVSKRGPPLIRERLLDEISSLVAVANGAKGMAWIKVAEDKWQSPIAKFFDNETRSSLNARLDAVSGDLILMVADQPAVTNASLGALRLEMARREKLIHKDEFAFVWITDFPLLEYDDEAEALCGGPSPIHGSR